MTQTPRLDPLDTGSLNRTRQILGDLVIHVDHDLAFVVFDLLERHAPHDAVAQGFDAVPGLDDTGDENSGLVDAVVFDDDYVLRDVNQTAREVARVGGFQSRIGQAIAGAVRRDEVFEHCQPFTEVGRDRSLDDFARRFRHQSAHPGELTDLLFRSSSAGIGHNVNRVELAFFVAPLHLAEHFIGNFFRDRRPDFDDLVVAFAVGDGPVQVLLLNCDDQFVGVLYQGALVVWDDHVIDADRQAGTRGITEAERLDLVEHLDRDFQAKPQVPIRDRLADCLLLKQAVDVWHRHVDARHRLRQVIVQNGPPNPPVPILPHNLSKLRVV